jgi:hypothetical protein
VIDARRNEPTGSRRSSSHKTCHERPDASATQRRVADERVSGSKSSLSHFGQRKSLGHEDISF